MFGLFKKLFKRRIRYHDVKKFLNTNDLFFDVGAHLGDKSKELIKNKINVVMIEPQPECLKELKKLYSKNQFVTIIPMGLGRSKQKLEMSVNSKQPVISTFAEHWKTGRFSESVWDKKITVDITTLETSYDCLDLDNLTNDSPFKKGFFAELDNLNYQLYGISIQGGSMNGGHYYSICKSDEQWYRYNDESVNEIRKEDVFNKVPYCLFYKRI